MQRPSEESAVVALENFGLDELIASFDHSCRFVRYGDFELFAMQGMEPACNRKRPSRGKICATSSVAEDLWSTFNPVWRKPYYYALQPLTLRKNIVPHMLQIEVNWVNADVLHKANMKGRLYPLVAWLKEHRVGLVGPEHLQELSFLCSGGAVTIPFGAADLERDRILGEVHRLIQSDVDAVVFSASYLANLAIHVFHVSTRAALIDCGSIWEPYVGIHNRKYHKQLSDATKRKNMEG